MTYRQHRMEAFADELEKISGSLQGYTRVGRRPISAAKYLAKGTKKISEIVKTSGLSVGGAKNLALMGVGAYGLNEAQKVKRRYQLGKQIEYQQGM